MAYGGGLVATAMLLVLMSLEIATTSVSTYGPDTQVAKALFETIGAMHLEVSKVSPQGLGRG